MKRPTTLSATFVRTVRQPGRYGDGRGGHGLSLLVKPTKRRNKKRHLGRNQPCHRNLDNPPRTHQNRKRTPGSTQHRCTGGPGDSTLKIRQPRSHLPIPHRTDHQQHHHEQTLQRKQHRLCPPRHAKQFPRLVRRNRHSPRDRRTSPRPRNQKPRRKSLRQNRPTRTTPRTHARMEPLHRFLRPVPRSPIAISHDLDRCNRCYSPWVLATSRLPDNFFPGPEHRHHTPPYLR